MKRAAFSEKVIDLPPDCALFLFSDAMIESRLETGELFGEERLMEAARLAPEQSPDKPMNALLRTFFDQVNLPLDDDLTAIWIDRIGAAAKAKAQADPDG